MRRSMARGVLVLTFGVGAVGLAGAAQQAKPEPDVLGSLLVEVRGLRAAMEQMAVSGAQVQLAMGRLQLNEQRIATYSRRLDEVQDRLVVAERDVRAGEQRLSEFEDALRKMTPPDPTLEVELRRGKAEVAQSRATLSRLQTEQTRLTQLVADEQARWTEINNRLDELDRLLQVRK